MELSKFISDGKYTLRFWNRCTYSSIVDAERNIAVYKGKQIEGIQNLLMVMEQMRVAFECSGNDDEIVVNITVNHIDILGDYDLNLNRL